MATANLDFRHWMFLDDDSSDPDTCTQLTGEDPSSPPAFNFGTPFMLRVAMQETANSNDNGPIKLQYQKNGSGGYADVGDATATNLPVRVTNGTPADDSACNSNLLTVDAGAFSNGVYEEATTVTSSVNVAKGDSHECQWCLEFYNDGNWTNGDYIEFHVASGDGSYTVSNTVTARVDYSSATTHLAATSVSGTASIAPAGGIIQPALVSVSGTGTIAASSSVDRPASIAVSGTGMTAAAGTVTAPPQVAITFAEMFIPKTAPGGVTRFGAAAVSATATIAPAGGRTLISTSAPTATATVASIPRADRDAAIAVSATGTSSALSAVDRPAAIAVSGTATISTQAQRNLGATASVSGVASIAPAALKDIYVLAATTSTATLVAASAVDRSGSASVSGTASAAQSAQMIFGAAASVTATATTAATGSTVGQVLGASAVDLTATMAALGIRDRYLLYSVTGTATAGGLAQAERAASALASATASITPSALVDLYVSASVSCAATVTPAASRDIYVSIATSLTASVSTNGQPVTFLRPTTDITDGSWLNELGSNVNLYASVDEGQPYDNTDYIESGALPDTTELRITSSGDPAASDYHTVQYALAKQGTSTLNLDVYLMEGTTQIAHWTDVDIPATETLYQHTLSGAEADSITDYTNLRIRFTVSVGA